MSVQATKLEQIHRQEEMRSAWQRGVRTTKRQLRGPFIFTRGAEK